MDVWKFHNYVIIIKSLTQTVNITRTNRPDQFTSKLQTANLRSTFKIISMHNKTMQSQKNIPVTQSAIMKVIKSHH